MWQRRHEFFESDTGRLSMTRLLLFMSYWPATYVMVMQPTETIFGLFLGAFVMGYAGGKSADTWMDIKKSKANSGNRRGAGNSSSANDNVSQG